MENRIAWRMGLYGVRATALVGNPVTYPLPPYLASLIVSETPDALEQVDETALAAAVFHALRPYGGQACVWGALADPARINEIIQDEETFHGACVRQAGEFVLLARTGSLPGAADWSHEEANAARTGASEDKLQAPTAVLWFDAAHRWHRQPGHLQVRVSGGRLLILEAGLLRATDVYTGRELWAVDLPIGQAIPDPGARPGIHRQPSRPRSLAAATELVALEDAIYLTDGAGCKVLDPTTGQTATRFELPESLTAAWSNLRACGDYLVGTSGASVVCVDRSTGELLWKFETGRTALSLAVGGGRVFVAELADPRRGEDETVDGLTRALDIATGEPLWEQQGGARLRYSAPLDLLVTPLSFLRAADGEIVTRLPGEPEERLIVTRWGRSDEHQPGFLAGRMLVTLREEGWRDISPLSVHDIPGGERLGEPLQWPRRGCTNVRASTKLITTRYRSNSAWLDLESREITPFFGVRPGCQVNNNLFAANGVLNMPNLTGGCTCNFAPASLATVPAEVVRRGGAE